MDVIALMWASDGLYKTPSSFLFSFFLSKPITFIVNDRLSSDLPTSHSQSKTTSKMKPVLQLLLAMSLQLVMTGVSAVPLAEGLHLFPSQPPSLQTY